MGRGASGFHFSVSANLLRIIGEELVASDQAAIWELVKNAYDSGAHNVAVTIEPVSDRNAGFIRIVDDGQGMSKKDFERLFMLAGYSERPEEAERAVRVPTGEKGIGRFATARLGHHLRLVTRADPKVPEVLEVTFDWRRFGDKKKHFDRSRSVPSDGKSCVPKGRTGTVLEITRLRSDWSRERIEGLREALGELLDPYNRPKDFDLVLNLTGSDKLSGPIGLTPPEDANLELHFRVLGDKRISRKLLSSSAPSSPERQIVSSKASTGSLVGLIGRFLYYFGRPPKAKTKGLSPGVRIYRDGVHLEPFGSPTADWLGISAKRAKRAGHAHIVPSRLYGFVEISRIKHQQLKDTTSRQALIDNEAAQGLVTVLREQLDVLEENIRTRVSEPKWEAGRRRKAIKLESARLHSLGMLSAGLGVSSASHSRY